MQTKSLQKYRGIIKLGSNLKLTEDQFLDLVEKDIYQKCSWKWPEEDWNKIKEEMSGEDILNSGGEVLYNRHSYTLNEKVFDTILHQMLSVIVNKTTPVLMKIELEIQLGLEQFISNEEKINYLKQRHSEYFTSIGSDIAFLDFMQTEEEDLPNMDFWKYWIWDFHEAHHIMRYLSTFDSIYSCFEEFMTKWERFRVTKEMILFCRNKIQELSNFNTSPVGNTSNTKKFNTVQKTFLLQEIMKMQDYWYEYSVLKRGKILSKLFDVHPSTARTAIDNLSNKVKKKQNLEEEINQVKDFLKNCV